MLAKGTFEVNIVPQQDRLVPGLGRMTIDKTFSGDLAGESRGQMLSGGNFKTGSAGYVAMESFTGSLFGKQGGFIMQHSAVMHQGAENLSVTIVPGSGSGELAGIAGSLSIAIKDKQHYYDLEYTL